MNIRWLTLALAAGLLASCTEDSARPRGDADDADRTSDESDDAPPLAGALDAGKNLDAGRADAGKQCDAGGSCRADASVGRKPSESAGEIGASCMEDEDCGGAGLTCLRDVSLPIGGSLVFPGGYCTKACTSDEACGSASCPLAAAAQFAADLSNCMTRCESDDACREGYVCSAVPAFGAAPASPQKNCLPPTPLLDG